MGFSETNLKPDIATDDNRDAKAGMEIAYIELEKIKPDPLQPRRILPYDLYVSFHNGEIAPDKVLANLIEREQRVRGETGTDAKQFIAALLADVSDHATDDSPVPVADNSSTEDDLLSDGNTLHSLVLLASTLLNDSQVNPLTVVRIGTTSPYYRIETGERRYWATWLLKEFFPSSEHDGTIPCIVIPHGKASVFRQAKENNQRVGNTDIGKAREAALLLLHVYDYPRPEGPVSNDYYRQARTLDLRGKREFTAEILRAMGGIHKSQFSRYKALLDLPDEAIELADRHAVEERKLRPVLSLRPEQQFHAVSVIIKKNLTARQAEKFCKSLVQAKTPKDTNPGNPASSDRDVYCKQAAEIAKLTQLSYHEAISYYLAEFIMQENGINLQQARSRLELMRQIIDDAATYLDQIA